MPLSPFPSGVAEPGSVAELWFETLQRRAALTDDLVGGDGITINNVNGAQTFAVDLASSTPLTFAQGALDFQIEAGGPLTVSSGDLAFTKASAVSAATVTSLSLPTVSTADAPTQGAAYVQADVQAIADLANEAKADLNTLSAQVGTLESDVAGLRDTINALRTALQGNGSLST